jgi:uncharacterized repeat protein (TIGR01451 family)
VSVTSDRSAYSRGQTVTFTEKITNAGANACVVQASQCSDPVTVNDSGGHLVWSSTQIGMGSCPVPTSYTLAPGQSVSYTFTWNQTENRGSASGQASPSGAYTAYGHWNNTTSAGDAFTIS